MPGPNDAQLSSAQLSSALREADAVCPTVTDRIDAEVIGEGPLRAGILANYGVGFNHIDVDAARAAGVLVSNTPDVLTDCTADLTMGLLLSVARGLGSAERLLRADLWKGWSPTHVTGVQVSRRTLGLVGFGRIAQAVARRAAEGFGMRVLVYTPRPPLQAGAVARDVCFRRSLEEMLPEVDFLSLHCPGGPLTRHLISADRLRLLRPDAFLINTSRGSVVDQQALIDALHSGSLAGAALDVYEDEPDVPAALKTMENVVLSPHLGSATIQTRIAMGMRVVENLLAFFAGQNPPDCVS